MRADGDGDGEGEGDGGGDARDGVVVVVLATSRDRDEAHLDGLAADAHASEADEADEGDDDDDDGRGARAEGDDEEERRERRRARWATRRRIFVATRKRERVRESANIGGLLTRATLNALERKIGQTSASWGQFLRSKQRSMQRLPPGTSSSIRLSSNRCVAIETERVTFAKPARNVGRRRGVFVGVNYEECGREEWRLRRRGSDAIRMRDYLKTHCGYDEDDELMVLVEDAEARATDGSVNRVCSKRAILKACRWLSQGAKEGDSLFFYFSGRQDVVGDESDKNFKGSEKTALCASDTPGDATQRISRRELREALVEGLPPNAYLTVFLDIFGGGGENALDKLPYSCVDVHLPDEKEIKNSKSGKGTTTVAPLWMVPRGEKMVKDFLELTKSVSRLHAESTKAMNDFYDKYGASARAAETEAQKRRDAEIEEREKRKAEEERQKRESAEEEERRRRVEREEAERRRIEEEERQKRESAEEEERRRRVEREEAERRRIEEEERQKRESAEEEERRRRVEREEAERRRIEEEERQKRESAEEEERRRRVEREEAERRRIEEEERQKRESAEEEERRRRVEREEAERRRIEEEERQKRESAEEEERRRRVEREEAERRRIEEEERQKRESAEEEERRRRVEREEAERRRIEEEERQKRESAEEEERRRRVEREEAERRRIEEEERQKRESAEEEERRRRVEREEAERRRIEEEDAASRRERDSTQTRRDEGASQVETGLEGDDGSGMSESFAEKKRRAAEFARKEAKEADRTRLKTYEFIETTPSEVQLTKKGQPSCCTIA